VPTFSATSRLRIDRLIEKCLDTREVNVGFGRRNLLQSDRFVVLQVHRPVLIQGFVSNNTNEILQCRVIKPDGVLHEAGIRIDPPLRDESAEGNALQTMIFQSHSVLEHGCSWRRIWLEHDVAKVFFGIHSTTFPC
jgi:hypothetical protein